MKKPAPLSALVEPDGVLVFAECPAEVVAAVVFRNEIKISGVHGIEGRFDRDTARIADGSRRQPGPHVGIVRRVEMKVFGPEPAVVRPLALEGIDDRRVAVELHARPQAVVEHGRNEPPLAGKRCFLLDEGGQNDRIAAFP